MVSGDSEEVAGSSKEDVDDVEDIDEMGGVGFFEEVATVGFFEEVVVTVGLLEEVESPGRIIIGILEEDSKTVFPSFPITFEVLPPDVTVTFCEPVVFSAA